tara:strand:- start:1099 stop:2235 length:1137 start_codon:yes stop_codon:yes gene_type:complete
MNLSKYIAELLIKNNCVIVPNFGGFIANYQSAIIDKVRNKIYPPSKTVLFNPNLLSNDGLLADFVARQIDKSYSEAIISIDNEVVDWKDKLLTGSRINLGEVGFLYQKEGKIQFEQNREFNLLLDAYGLSSVKFIASNTKHEEVRLDEGAKIIHFSPSEALIEKQLKSENIPGGEIKKSKSNKWKYAAVACAIPFLFYVGWIPMNTSFLDTGNIQVSDFNPLNKKAVKIYSTRKDKTLISGLESIKSWDDLTENINSNVEIYNYKFDDELYIPVKLDQKSTQKSTLILDKKTEELEVDFSESTKANKGIHLIAGCFSSKTNANALVNDLKSNGYSAFIVDKNKGLYRVSAESFASKNEAKSVKDKLSSESVSTWILNK